MDTSSIGLWNAVDLLRFRNLTGFQDRWHNTDEAMKQVANSSLGRDVSGPVDDQRVACAAEM